MRRFALLVGLLLLVWISRLIGIAVFPPFIDETIHIQTGEVILQNGTPLYNVVLGRQLTVWWMMLFQPASAAPIWVARVTILLAVLPGFAALLALARSIAGSWAALFFGLFYLFSAYHQVFERLALADPFAGSLVSLAIFFAYRLSRRVRLTDALITGVLLFAVFVAKTSATPYFGIPIAAVVALGTKGSFQLRARWLIVALGSAFILTALFTLAMRLHGYDVITNTLSLALSGRGPLDSAVLFSPARVIGNIGLGFNTFAVYMGAVPLLLMLTSVLVLIIRRHWYLPLCLLGPLLIIWINTVQETRYYVTVVALLLLCAAIALALLIRNSSVLRRQALTLILIWGCINWLPFALTAAREPAALPLPATDAGQYVMSDAAGFGFAEVYTALRDRQPRQVIGALANCQGLRFTLPTGYPITCPLMRPNGQDREALAALFEANRSVGTYVVLEDSPYAPSSAPGVPIAVIDVGRPRLTIHSLAP